MTIPSHYSAAALAKMFNLSEHQIRQLTKAGIIPKTKAGQYDMFAAIPAYIQSIRRSGNKKTSEYQRQKTRLVKIQADHAAFLLARDQAKLLEAKTVNRLRNACFAKITQLSTDFTEVAKK